MNYFVLIRRTAIVIVSFCLILNIGYNFITWIKLSFFSGYNFDMGTLHIYSSSISEIKRAQEKYFPSESFKTSISFDTTQRTVYVLELPFERYNTSKMETLLKERKERILIVISKDKEKSIVVGSDFETPEDAEAFRQFLKEKTGVDASVVSRILPKIYCLSVNDISFKDAELFGAKEPELDVQWTPYMTD